MFFFRLELSTVMDFKGTHIQFEELSLRFLLCTSNQTVLSSSSFVHYWMRIVRMSLTGFDVRTETSVSAKKKNIEPCTAHALFVLYKRCKRTNRKLIRLDNRFYYMSQLTMSRSMKVPQWKNNNQQRKKTVEMKFV